MHRIAIRRLLPALLATVAAGAQAQGAAAPTAPDPLDAQAQVPAVVYRSALAAYRQLGDDPPVPWREANDTAHRIGGWRAYAREASRPDPDERPAAAVSPSSDAATPPRTMPSPRPGGPLQ